MKYHDELQQAEQSYQTGHSLTQAVFLLSLAMLVAPRGGVERGGLEDGHTSASTWAVKPCFIWFQAAPVFHAAWFHSSSARGEQN